MRISAPAKINLFLSVGARRPDGLHGLVSVMQAISLADTLTIVPADALAVTSSISLDGENLAARAAEAFATTRGLEPLVSIDIEKRIPVAAGLGGGSADAAATLVGLNDLWDARASRKALEKLAAPLGSDVPFCVRGGTAVVAGTGEDLSVLACPEPVWWVLGISPEHLSTADVYAEFDRIGGGALDDPFEVADSLARADVARLGGALRNDLERAAISLMPSLGAGRDALLDAGAVAAIVSGSGPTWLGLARDEQHARAVASACGPAFARIEVAHSLGHGPRALPV